jgi:hypothetical protein
LITPVPASAIYTNQHVVNAQSTLATKGSLAQRFAGARHVFTLQLIEEIFSMVEMQQPLSILSKQVQLHVARLNENSITWLHLFTEKYNQLKSVADKFAIRAHELMKDDAEVEKNTVLQKRINDAAGYFIPVINQLKTELQHHEIVTEHKEIAAVLDEPLHELMHAFIKSSYYLQYAVQPFEVAGFLKHKLNLAIPRFHITTYAAHQKQNSVSDDIPNPELYFKLKNWRDRICNEENIPVYLVANSDTLKEICLYLPATKQHLLLLSGFGKTKTERFGDEVLDIVETYCNQYGLETKMEAKSAHPKKQRREKSSQQKEEKIPSAKISLTLYKQDKSIKQIAEERNLSVGTIESHLISFIKTGEVAVDVFASDELIATIQTKMKQHPNKTHTEIKSMLGDAVSFNAVRAAAQHLLKKEL